MLTYWKASGRPLAKRRSKAAAQMKRNDSNSTPPEEATGIRNASSKRHLVASPKSDRIANSSGLRGVCILLMIREHRPSLCCESHVHLVRRHYLLPDASTVNSTVDGLIFSGPGQSGHEKVIVPCAEVLCAGFTSNVPVKELIGSKVSN
jgi:hypothetical protein